MTKVKVFVCSERDNRSKITHEIYLLKASHAPPNSVRSVYMTIAEVASSPAFGVCVLTGVARSLSKRSAANTIFK